MAWLRHPVRSVSTALALSCLAWPLTSAVGVGAVVLGAFVGVVAGELLGRSKWRGWVVALGILLAFLAFQSLAALWLRVEWLARVLGPPRTLSCGLALRFFGWSAFPTAGLRALAKRVRPLIMIELAACLAGIAFLFAAHRGGNVARPLWLGDYAWRAGLDPAVVLLAAGTASFVLMAVVLATEHGRRTSAVTLLALPLLAWLVFASFEVMHFGQLPNDSERDSPITAHGEPPKLPKTNGKVEPKENPGNRNKDGTDGVKPDPVKGDADGSKGQPNEQDEPSDGSKSPPPDEPPPLDAPPPPDSPENQQPMAIVLLGDDYDPPAQMFYFRQETWSQFAGNRLVPTTRPDADNDVPGEFPTRRQEVLDPPPPAARKLIHATVAMVLRHKKPFALETPVAMDVAPNPDPHRFARAYRFESLAQSTSYADMLGAKAGNPAWSEELRAYYTAPAKDPRFGVLAKEITSSLDAKKREVPLFKALSIKLWMDQHLTYSTQSRHADVPDPAADFLFGDRVGYCVHFAHVAVYLWRSLGLPARIGMGYAVNAESRDGSALMVKSGDGHAWPEVYLEGIGWLVLDIAPKKNLDAPARPLDKELQRKLAELARTQPLEKPKNVSQPPVRAPKRTVPWAKLGRMALLTVFAALFMLALVKAWRRNLPRFIGPHRLPRVGYRAALDMLSELGLARHEGETREAFARRLETAVPTFGRLTDWHIADHFGDPNRSDTERPERALGPWRTGLAALREECRPLRRNGRAWLGRVNPASFLASK